MSSSLYWEPVNKENKYFPDELKYALRKRFGSLIERVALNYDDVSYLEGLRDAGVKGAEELISAIEKHDEVVIWEAS